MSNLTKEPQITENELDPAFLTRTRISSEIALPTEDSTSTNIKIDNFFLTNMNCIKFMCLADNNGSNTTINGKNLYKSGGTSVPSLKRGKIYTVYYKKDSDCVFSIASAEGNATVSDVLAGKIFSNENDTGLVGSMPIINNGNNTINCGVNYNIPKGYHDGNENVTANSLANQTIGNATAEQILQGYNAWVNGVNIPGKATIQSLGAVEIMQGQLTIPVPTDTRSSLYISIPNVKNFTKVYSIYVKSSYTHKYNVFGDIRTDNYYCSKDILIGGSNNPGGWEGFSGASSSSSTEYRFVQTCKDCSSINLDSVCIFDNYYDAHSNTLPFTYGGDIDITYVVYGVK